VKLLQDGGFFDAAAVSGHKLTPKSVLLLDVKIHCLDESGRLVERTIIDCGTSAVSGDYYVIQDENGMKTQIIAAELDEICVD